MNVLVIGEREVHDLLPMSECIEVMQQTFASLGEHGFVQPARIIAWQPDRTGAIAAMPGWLGKPQALGAKLISVFPQNRRAGIDSHQGFVALFESLHGSPRAIIHAGAITEVRTAAVSAVATRVLANDDATELALLGSGVQARAHLGAMLAVRPIRRVRVWSRTPENAQSFARDAAAKHRIEIAAAPTARDAVEGAEIICTVTASTTPVLHGAWLKGGEHINAAGSSVPPFRELDTEVVVRARVFVDSFESARREPDDIRVPIAEGAITEQHLRGDLAQLASGACERRVSKSDITVFKSVGLAIEDLAAAQAIYDRAIEQGRGTTIDL
jgi:ornithine cyclodeaminase/alanine dehydrogenase-like protein (mu-crystallin family)